MPRGYRHVLLAVVGGLALFAIWAGAEGAAVWADSPSAYPDYRESAEDAQKRLPTPSIQQALKAAKYQQPCRQPQSRDAADLCAQWRAADAAERSSRWAWWQMFLSCFGVAGLIVTLWFNFKAWEQTREGLNITRDIGQKQIRAYVSFGVCKIQYMKLTGLLAISTNIINSGQTPARSVVAEITVHLSGKNSNRKIYRRAPWPDIQIGDKGIYTVELSDDKMSLDDINEYSAAVISITLSGLDVFGNKFSGYIESLFVVRGKAGEAMGSIDDWTVLQRTMLTAKKNCLYDGEPEPEIDPAWGINRA